MMEPQLQKLYDAVEQHREEILSAERQIWKNPESGFREWKTHAFMKEHFEKLGYELVEAGNIPGFYADLDTGLPGPKIAVFGEMDALIIPTHPECDPETGAVHACGHNCQCAALMGLASALKEPGILEGFCGSIRLVAVPAEEGIEMEYRSALREKGILHYLSGKLEVMARGFLDGVDMAMMVHIGEDGFGCTTGSNGSITKFATFHGKAAHAGGSPHRGRNALYAASSALNTANALRETFREKDTIRFHPIITKGGSAVNAIPDEVSIEAYVRGANMQAIKEASDSINRAFAGCAAAMGCTVTISDEHGYAPRRNDAPLREIFREVALDFFSPDQVNCNRPHGTACSDMGDVSAIMPTVHPHIGSYSGNSHSDNFQVTDPVTACVTGAKIQLGVLYRLLEENGKQAKEIKAKTPVPFPNKEEYSKSLEQIRFHGQTVFHEEDGRIILHFKN